MALASQGAYALSNLGLTIFAAFALNPTDFGLFSMAIIGYLVVRGPIVAGIGHEAIIYSSTSSSDTIARCAAGGLRFGAGFGALGLLVAIVTTSPWLAVASLGFPVMICFEVLRVAALGVGQSGLALRGDLMWLGAQIGAAASAWHVIESWSLTAFAMLWIIGGLAALAAVSPNLRASWPTAGTGAPLNRTLALDDLLANGLLRGALASGALVVSATAVAQTRLAIVPFNVVAVAFASLEPMLLAQIRQAAGGTRQVFALWKKYLSLAIALTTLNLLGLLIGFSLFAEALGENFAAAAEVIWWIALLRVSSAATLIFSSTVKAHPACNPRSVLLPRMVQGALTLVLVITLGATVGWAGIAIGLSLGSLGGTCLWAAEALRIVGDSPSRIRLQRTRVARRH